MSQQMDLKAITSANVVYKKIDEEEKRFFEEISNKKIEPKNAMDFESIERIEPFMSKYIKNLNIIMKGSNFPPELKSVMTGKLIIGAYGGFAVKYNFEPMSIAQLFGKSHDKQIQKAIKDIKILS
jgi:hypothetical protein